MTKQRNLRLAATLVGTLLVGCAVGLSKDFRAKAVFAYHLVAGSDRSVLLRRDVDRAIAEAKAAVQTDSDKKAMQILEHYVTAVEVAEDTDADRKLVGVCQWEVAHDLETEEPYLGHDKPLVGDCQRLFSARTERVMAEFECSQQNVEPIRQQQMKALEASKTALYDQLGKQRKQAEAKCRETAEEASSKRQAPSR